MQQNLTEARPAGPNFRGCREEINSLAYFEGLSVRIVGTGDYLYTTYIIAWWHGLVLLPYCVGMSTASVGCLRLGPVLGPP